MVAIVWRRWSVERLKYNAVIVCCWLHRERCCTCWCSCVLCGTLLDQGFAPAYVGIV